MAEKKPDMTATLFKLAEEAYRNTGGSPGRGELKALERYGNSILDRFGSIKGPGMSEPWPVDELSIKLNLLKAVISCRQHPTPEELEDAQERWEKKRGFGTAQKERIDARKLLADEPRLMLLGKPGAGKTTLLQFLAVKALRGELGSPASLPVLVNLKEWNKDDILDFLARELVESGLKNAREFLKMLLEQGNVLLLLDDLDESGGALNFSSMQEQISELAGRYEKNRFIVTRRLAAENDSRYFKQFANAELTDFDESQIANFVRNWFGRDKQLAANCLAQLNESIHGLAVNPLLLTLLCRIQEERKLPQSRADLFQYGLEVLLKTWDEERGNQGMEQYRKIPLQGKQELLGRIARTFFARSFFLRSELEQKIGIFLLGVVEGAPQPADILKAIVLQHGLIVERSHDIYSFSHLCFQEYLTAWRIKEKIVAEGQRQVSEKTGLSPKVKSLFSRRSKDEQRDPVAKLVKQITKYRWREVFIMTSEILGQEEVDRLLLLMKQQTDAIIGGNMKLQRVLLWAEEKAAKIDSANHPAAVRGFYLALDRAMARAFTRRFTSARALDPASACDPAIEQALESVLGRSAKTAKTSQTLALDLTLDLALTMEVDQNMADNMVLEFPNMGSSSDYAQGLGLSKLTVELDKLKKKHPKPSANEAEWRAWEDKLRHLMLWFRNLGHNFDLEESDNKQLKIYLYANKLLAGCLHSATHVSQNVRQQILNTLLLPTGIE